MEAGNPGAVVRRALRLQGAGLMVAGGSREVLLAAEGECAVLYTGCQKAQALEELRLDD